MVKNRERKSVAASGRGRTCVALTTWNNRAKEKKSEEKYTYADTPREDRRNKKLCRNPVKGLFCAATDAVGCETTLTLKWN